MEKVNLKQKLSLFSDHWRPKIIGELNDAYVKVVKAQGEFVWHHHDDEDEFFLVLDGRIAMALINGRFHRKPNSAINYV